MKYWLSVLKWNIEKVYTSLTYYQILVLSLSLWLVGSWIWIFPQYISNARYLNVESGNIQKIIEDKLPKSGIEEKTINNEKFNYSQMLTLTMQYQVKLEEFKLQQVLSKNKKYQIKVRGSWLSVREFLSGFNNIYQSSLYIDLLEFQRDPLTNELNLNMQVITGDGP